jgi:hypothetical protein
VIQFPAPIFAGVPTDEIGRFTSVCVNPALEEQIGDDRPRQADGGVLPRGATVRRLVHPRLSECAADPHRDVQDLGVRGMHRDGAEHG